MKNSSLSRRQFLRTSSAVAGGLSLVSLPLVSSAYAAGTDTIKVALIGCGGRGTGATIQALSVKHNVQLVAMADAFRDRLDGSYKHLQEWAAKNGKSIQVPEEHKFTGFDAYQKAIPLADVVILATPPGFRPGHFAAAVAQNKHVFMEKPVAVDAPGIRKVLAAAEEAKNKNLKVVVGLHRHYKKSYTELAKRLIDGNQLGELVSARCYWNDGGVWMVPRKPDMTEMEYQMRNWYYFNWLCGDHILEQHIHNIDVINWMKGSYPTSAEGVGGRQVRTGKEYGEIFDHHSVEFVYPDGMILNSQCKHHPDTVRNVSEQLVGTRGRATEGLITDLRGNTLWKHDSSKDADPFQVEHDVLFDCIVHNKPKNDAYNGAMSTLTALIGRMATYSGKRVTQELALASTLDLMPEHLAWEALPKSLPDANGYYAIAVPGKTLAF